jgi:hypothetical protein
MSVGRRTRTLLITLSTQCRIYSTSPAVPPHVSRRNCFFEGRWQQRVRHSARAKSACGARVRLELRIHIPNEGPRATGRHRAWSFRDLALLGWRQNTWRVASATKRVRFAASSTRPRDGTFHSTAYPRDEKRSGTLTSVLN